MPFFAKSSHFVLVTRGKSTQARLRRVQVGVLWEKTAWNLNISDLERLLLAFVLFFLLAWCRFCTFVTRTEEP